MFYGEFGMHEGSTGFEEAIVDDETVYDESAIVNSEFTSDGTEIGDEPIFDEEDHEETIQTVIIANPDIAFDSVDTSEMRLLTIGMGSTGITAMYWVGDERLPGIDVVAVPDLETAVFIANAVFRSMQNEMEFLKNFHSVSALFDEINEIWIVDFQERGKENWVGDCISIALQKSDGRVLKVWAGE